MRQCTSTPTIIIRTVQWWKFEILKNGRLNIRHQVNYVYYLVIFISIGFTTLFDAATMNFIVGYTLIESTRSSTRNSLLSSLKLQLRWSEMWSATWWTLSWGNAQSMSRYFLTNKWHHMKQKYGALYFYMQHGSFPWKSFPFTVINPNWPV